MLYDKNSIEVEQIAEACHEVNRAYCQALGDSTQVPWNEAPNWQKESAIKGVLLHINSPNAGPEASHISWLIDKIENGWFYGLEKDPIKKTHPCMVSFKDLPVEQQAKDFIFRSVVHSMAKILLKSKIN